MKIRIHSDLSQYQHRIAYIDGRGFVVLMKNAEKNHELFFPFVFLGSSHFLHRKISRGSYNLKQSIQLKLN